MTMNEIIEFVNAITVLNAFFGFAPFALSALAIGSLLDFIREKMGWNNEWPVIIITAVLFIVPLFYTFWVLATPNPSVTYHPDGNCCADESDGYHPRYGY